MIDQLASSKKRLLIVDDDDLLRRLLVSVLEADFIIEEADGRQSVLEHYMRFKPDLVVLDLGLPRVDGFAICRGIKQVGGAIPSNVIILSGQASPQDMQLAFDQGADDYLQKPITPLELKTRLSLHDRLIDARRLANLYSTELSNQCSVTSEILESRREEQQAIQDAAIYSLAKVAESRDNETGNHLIRISEFSGVLSAALVNHPIPSRRLSKLESLAIPRLSTLHDIGKVGIPDAILLKPGSLNDEEWRIMKTHTTIGWEILEEAVRQFPSANFLRGGAIIAKYHHERWDGTGYPNRLREHEIPLMARVVAIADVFDALTSNRPYRTAWTTERTRQHIVDGSGTHFDPVLVDVFLENFLEFERIQRLFDEPALAHAI